MRGNGHKSLVSLSSISLFDQRIISPALLMVTFKEVLLAVVSLMIATGPVTAFGHTLSSVQPTKTVPSQQQPPILLQRDAPSGTVNIDLMPTCAMNACVNPTAPPLPCASVRVPCPSAIGGGDNCTTVDRDCYCKQTTPLACAWDCGWWDWMLAEDWFQTTCPNVLPINFNTAPACARKCLWENSVNYGCINSGRNCFCLEGSVFGCESKCSDNSTILAWLEEEDVCNFTSSEASYEAGITVSPKDSALPPLHKTSKLHWYEIFPIVVGSLSGAILLGVAINSVVAT